MAMQEIQETWIQSLGGEDPGIKKKKKKATHCVAFYPILDTNYLAVDTVHSVCWAQRRQGMS